MFEKSVKNFFRKSDISISSYNYLADIRTTKECSFLNDFYWKLTLSLGEDYMNDLVEIDDLVNVTTKIFRNSSLAQKELKYGILLRNLMLRINRLINWQKLRPVYYADIHYNLPPILFEKMLGKTLSYTCGYWKGLEMAPSNLDKAQEAKFQLILDKLGVKQGQVVLDFGSGWGSLAKFFAKKGIVVIGVNIAEMQLEYSKVFCKNLPISFLNKNFLLDSKESIKNAVENALKKYNLNKVNYITSLGVHEHIGLANYQNLLDKFQFILSDDGKILIHSIGAYKDIPTGDLFIGKYIFPDGYIPKPSKIISSAEKTGLKLIDYQNLEDFKESNYGITLESWLHNFDKNWDTIKYHIPLHIGDLELFRRKWRFYLALCVGMFRAGNILNLGHYLFAKISNKSSCNEPYHIIR